MTNSGRKNNTTSGGRNKLLAHHQNLEVKSFYSDPARRNVGFNPIEVKRFAHLTL